MMPTKVYTGRVLARDAEHCQRALMRSWQLPDDAHRGVYRQRYLKQGDSWIHYHFN